MVTDDEIIEMYIQDDPIVIPVTQIYTELSIGPSRLYTTLRKNSIDLRRNQGITSRGHQKSVMSRYNEQTRENVRLLHYIHHAPMTEIAAKLSMPYDHVRAMVLDLKLKDAAVIAEIDHVKVLSAFKGGATIEELRRDFHLTSIQLLLILDGNTSAQTLTEWGTLQGIVEQVVERVRADLNLQNSQGTLPL